MRLTVHPAGEEAIADDAVPMYTNRLPTHEVEKDDMRYTAYI